MQLKFSGDVTIDTASLEHLTLHATMLMLMQQNMSEHTQQNETE